MTRPTDPELAALLRELANNIDSFGADGLDLADQHALFQRFGPILYEFHRFDVRS